MNLRASLVFLTLLALLALPAAAQYDLYDNGPINGTVDAWYVNSGYVVSNSFAFVDHGWGCQPFGQCGINGVSFEAWLFPGDVVESVEISITSSEFGGTTYFDQTLNVTASNCYSNQLGFTLCTETASFNDVYLNNGTYWLNLQNAVADTGDPVYWDENSGPSRASQTSTGTIPSESFTILGQQPCYGCNDIPEPSSLWLLGVGAIPLLGALRRFIR